MKYIVANAQLVFSHWAFALAQNCACMLKDSMKLGGWGFRLSKTVLICPSDHQNPSLDSTE